MNKILYRAAPGLAWVNGARVPDSGTVELTATEAAFDLSLGRIAPDQPLPASEPFAESHEPPDGGTSRRKKPIP